MLNRFLPLALATSVSMFAMPALAQKVDGIGSPGEYNGGTNAVVNYNPAAPTSNFATPTNQATTGYTIQLKDSGSSLFGLLTQNGGTPDGAFANLYFDLNPTKQDGSDLGFELGANSANAFIPGRDGKVALDPSLFSVALGGGTFEFRLDNKLFTSAIAGLNYYSDQTFESQITLRLSQSFGYSVAGGATYGPDRLGSVSVASAVSAVPEPATWGMMLLGFGVMGVALRRRRAVPARLQHA